MQTVWRAAEWVSVLFTAATFYHNNIQTYFQKMQDGPCDNVATRLKPQNDNIGYMGSIYFSKLASQPVRWAIS